MKEQIIKWLFKLILLLILLILMKFFSRELVQEGVVILALLLNPDKIIDKIRSDNGTNK